MSKTLQFLLLVILLGGALHAQKPAPATLRSGPMVGYSEMREVMLWAQTTAPASVQFRYWEVGDSASPERHLTDPVQTAKESAYTAHCVADRVMPGKRYQAELLLNGKPHKLAHPIKFQAQALWQYRTEPPAFKFATGSCAFINEPAFDRPGKPYGGDMGIFGKISAEAPDFMLWLGDNVYLREADWNTRTGIHHRYTHSRSQPELQPLLSQAHHYAIWDDHDYGPNDADHSFTHKDLTLQAFQSFWANPSYGLNGHPGTTSRFQWADCDFFLLDNRSYRSGWAQTVGQRSMIGQEQLQWLLDGLKGSFAPFKFVCIGGQVLSTAAVYENYANTFSAERQFILDAIQREGIPGVIFLTGDRHHTALSHWQPEGGLSVYDLTVSPLTSGAYPGDGEKNKWLVQGTEVAEQNYAVMEVSGPRKARVLHIRIHDKSGKLLWERDIEAGK